MVNENLKIRGRMEIFNSRTGKLLYEKNNLIVNTGLHYLIDMLKVNRDPIGWIEVGTGTNVVSAGDTALQIPLMRKEVTDIDTIGNVFTAETQFEDLEAVAVWKECGMFNASSGGIMFNRININFDKTTEDAVRVKFTITLIAG